MDLQERKLEEYQALNPNELTEKQFCKIRKEIKKPERNTISDEYFDFKLWCLGMLSQQEYFAKYCTEKMLKKFQKSVVAEHFDCQKCLQQRDFA